MTQCGTITFMNDSKIEFIKAWLGAGSINIFGIQFSGKDTVGKRLADDLDTEFLSSGDIVRAARNNNPNEDIRKATKLSDSGVLTPTDEFKQLIIPYLYDKRLDGKPLVLGSVGRWIGEETSVLNALKKGDHDTKAILVLNISEDEIWRRWNTIRNERNGGRLDDMNKNRVKTRLDEFRDKTLPVINKYREMDLVIDINGEQSRDQVYDETINKLYEFAKLSKSN